MDDHHEQQQHKIEKKNTAQAFHPFPMNRN